LQSDDPNTRLAEALERFAYLPVPTARLTRIAIYRNRQHEIVGYCAVHFHDSEVFQYSKACVIRAESGILPEYRGSNQSIPFLTRQVLRYKLLNPGKRLLFL
ncbi:hypothetical protein AAIH38_35230, partial [Pseudomonas aeruginosa]|uniref:hypothetical protein n=1 Tax=Pseudomonas aeruginosa TaxID=287 RepID=UPI0031B67B2E